MDSPSLLLCVGSSGADRRELSKHTCQLLPLSVLVRQDCQKGGALFLKDFQNFGIWSFEKSVEEMMLRVKVFTLGDLDSLSVDGGEGRGPGEKGTFKS